jgi:two-component system, response regulator PdtaR
MTFAQPPRPATLLIVEDEALVALVLCDALTDAGYHVLDLTAGHAEAMSVARGSRPDLALVNIDLENGGDGIALAEQLKALGVPVVFISGQTSRARSAATVAIASMPKPYDAEDMVLAVDYLLARLNGSTVVRPPKGLEVFEMDVLSVNG